MNICQAGHEFHDRILVDTKYGLMMIYDYSKYMGFRGYCTGQDDVSKTIDLYRIWEPQETQFVEKLLKNVKEKGLFIDIGAHIGWYSRLAYQLGYSVIAYEGDLENMDVLLENNPHIQAIPVWFNEHSEIKKIPDKRITLMKIDLEGAEQYAIKCFRDYLDVIDNMLIEVSPVFNTSYDFLLHSLKQKGFRAYYLDGKPFEYIYNFNQGNLWLKKE